MPFCKNHERINTRLNTQLNTQLYITPIAAKVSI
jgi:hypothetical protein